MFYILRSSVIKTAVLFTTTTSGGSTANTAAKPQRFANMSELDDGLKKRIRDWVWQQGFEHTASPGFPYAARRFAVELHTSFQRDVDIYLELIMTAQREKRRYCLCLQHDSRKCTSARCTATAAAATDNMTTPSNQAGMLAVAVRVLIEAKGQYDMYDRMYRWTVTSPTVPDPDLLEQIWESRELAESNKAEASNLVDTCDDACNSAGAA